jgi:uncharacterized protein (TIGR00369 family)
MPAQSFDLDTARELMQRVFAPWVRALDLEIGRIDSDGAMLRMPFDPALCREGGIVCGQALMALADTSMVFAVAAASGRYRPMTTVDVTTHMMKPISNADVVAHARILRLGRSMAFGRASLHAADRDEIAAMSTMAYALLPD